jgi:hypothetical protein
MELFLFIVGAFVFGGAVIGVFWRWHPVGLLALCSVLGFAISLGTRDWSHFDFAALVANARAGGGAWQSWCMGLVVYFIYSGVPAAVGGACGFALRQMRGRICRR